MSDYKDLPIPALAGIGLRSPHYQEIANNKPNIKWLEVHPENFFCDGGIALHMLERIRESYPVSCHGVGLSLGSTDDPDTTHLRKLKKFIDHINPALISEHISWSAVDGVFLNDLLPLPYTKEAVDVVSCNVLKTQDFLGRKILVENPSTYLEFNGQDMTEYEFLTEVVKKTGCGILLDVNNIYVSSQNHGLDAYEYLQNIPKNVVGEIHLAGHAQKDVEGKTILIDHHGDYVAGDVWDLYAQAIKLLGPIPTLIEWDTDIPELGELIKEAEKAQNIMDRLANAA